MAGHITDGITELRNQALYAMLSTPEGRVLLATPRGNEFKVLDEALSKVGGASILARQGQPQGQTSVTRTRSRSASTERKMTQTDYAEKALRSHGEPLPIGRLAEQTVAAGGTLGGADPIANFRSNLSRDTRFKSVMRNSMYFWWFADEPEPAGWRNEAAEDGLLNLSAASSISTSEEGGDGNATATT